MSDLGSEPSLAAHLEQAESWSADRARSERRLLRTAWIVAGAAIAVALLEAIALILLTPLKTVVPYTLLVDRQTGYVEALQPLDPARVALDRALTRSMLAQYVIAREGFDIDSLQADYRKVGLWSVGDARDRYIASMQASNPASPLATLPRRALVAVEVRSISPLGTDTVMVRFATRRLDAGAPSQAPQTYVAVVRYRFSGAGMSAGDRLVNPLGFQVLRYRRDAEIVPEPLPAPAATPVQMPPQMPMRLQGEAPAGAVRAVPVAPTMIRP